jgi:hypothetical protein
MDAHCYEGTYREARNPENAVATVGSIWQRLLEIYDTNSDADEPHASSNEEK